MTTNTVRLHRVLRATPERIYRAFLNADAMAKWLPPYGFTCKVHHMDTKVGAPTYADKLAVVQAYITAAPERVVWGSDWPHPTEKADAKPDDAVLVDLLTAWAPDEKTRNRILVDNPATLYGFAKSS